MDPIKAPEFSSLEEELISEFLDCFRENVEEIEIALQHLQQDASDAGIHELFRSLHSLKGNCRMVFLDPLVQVTHDLEEIVQEFRDHRREYSDDYGEFVGNSVNAINTLLQQITQHGEAERALYERCCSQIAEVKASQTPSSDLLLTDPVSTQQPPAPASEPEIEVPEAAIDAPSESSSPQDSASDIKLFRHLATQLDNSNVFRKERTAKELTLCRTINELLNNPVDPQQLDAAVMLHDVGMAFVPAGIINKTTELQPAEKQAIQAHVSTGEMLARQLDNWHEAADMVRHHHEYYDGSGYPAGLVGAAIPLGARIIAISDTFFAVSNERPDRSYKKNIFSAVSLINAQKDIQFDPDCVEAFNMAVRKLYISK